MGWGHSREEAGGKPLWAGDMWFGTEWEVAL